VPLEEDLWSQLREFLGEHDRLWGALDVAGLAGLWDPEDDLLTYLGDEYSLPVVGQRELAQHWGRIRGRLQGASVTSTLFLARRLGDLALAVFLMEWQLVTVESPEPRAGQRWVTAVLRRRQDGWRFLHYAESSAYQVEAARLRSSPGPLAG
jgi:ketosteroid isomerase-like protein